MTFSFNIKYIIFTIISTKLFINFLVNEQQVKKWFDFSHIETKFEYLCHGLIKMLWGLKKCVDHNFGMYHHYFNKTFVLQYSILFIRTTHTLSFKWMLQNVLNNTHTLWLFIFFSIPFKKEIILFSRITH